MIRFASISQITLANCLEVFLIRVNSFGVNTALFLFERHLLIQNMYATKIRLYRGHSPFPFSSLCRVCELIIQKDIHLRLFINPDFTYKEKGRAHNSSGYYENVFFLVPQPLVYQDLLIVEASRSPSGTPRCVKLLCTSDQTNAETSA